MKNLLFTALLLLLGGLFALAAVPEDAEGDVQYTGVLIGTGGVVGGATSWVDMYVERFTTQEETLELLKILDENGQDALVRRLEKRDIGSINIPSGSGPQGGRVGLSVARKIESETGTIIRLFTARPMTFLERYRGGRSQDYPFGLIELMLDKDGNGQGAVVAAAKVKITKEGRLELESLGNQYIKITNVRRVK
jgi:hypothetical protein